MTCRFALLTDLSRWPQFQTYIRVVSKPAITRGNLQAVGSVSHWTVSEASLHKLRLQIHAMCHVLCVMGGSWWMDIGKAPSSMGYFQQRAGEEGQLNGQEEDEKQGR